MLYTGASNGSIKGGLRLAMSNSSNYPAKKKPVQKKSLESPFHTLLVLQPQGY